MNAQIQTMRGAGFSLVELYIVIALIGILTAVAVPAWQEHVRHARRTSAVTTLSMIAARQARYLLEHRRYAQDAELFMARPAGLGIPRELTEYYVIEIRPDASGYLATATVRIDTSQRLDQLCHELTLDATGLQQAMSSTGVNTTGNCWS